MIRAVLFDYGMVLCTQDPDARRNLLALTGLDDAAFERYYWIDRRDLDLARFGGAEYWTRFARHAGLTFTPDQIAALVENDVLLWTNLSEPMLAWAAALQDAGLATAIVSNMVPGLLRYMRQEFAWLAHFDQLTWSCELGLAKPDAAIYTHTCERLNVRPEECLFLDDKPENVRGAEAVGMHALPFTTVDQLRSALQSRNWLQDAPQPGSRNNPPDEEIYALQASLK